MSIRVNEHRSIENFLRKFLCSLVLQNCSHKPLFPPEILFTETGVRGSMQTEEWISLLFADVKVRVAKRINLRWCEDGVNQLVWPPVENCSL